MNEINKSVNYRDNAIAATKRVLIKVGTRLLTDTSSIPKLMDQIHRLRENGYQVILVSSGAVGIGMKTLNILKRPTQLSKIQALASIGQGQLMERYEKAAQKLGFHTGQILLTASGVQNRTQHINMLNCINSLLEMNILPIINENDSVSVKELTFGDNDQLAVLVAAMIKCNTVILLTTVNGLRITENKKLGNRISVVSEISSEIKKMAMGTDDSNNSIGGMSSKLKAAEIAMSTGNYLWIADGRDYSIIEKIFNKEDVGTLFLPYHDKKLSSKKRWLSFFTKTKGQILIDSGAEKAIIKSGKSLLSSGILAVKGDFKRGDTVEIVSISNNVIAKGLTNYNISETSRICGINSVQIKNILGYPGDSEVIHRDNLVII